MNETNAQSPPGQTAPAARTARLRRRATNRVATGVASGLADYLNVDPLLIRVLFVGLVIFNGAGLFIYLAAWLFVPVQGRDASIVEGWIRRIGVSAGTAVTVTWILIGIVGTMALFDWLGPDVDGSANVRAAVAESAERAAFAVALVVIVVGVLLLRRTGTGSPSGFDASSPASAEAVGDWPPPPPAATVEHRDEPPRERSPLSFYVLGALLLAVGTLAAVDSATSAEVLPRHYAGLAVSVVGLGLIMSAWLGRARWLILLGVVLIPFALALSFAHVPADQGWGSRRITPTSEAQLGEEYSLAVGRLTIDLTELPRSTETHHVRASIGAGLLVVILPEGARVETEVEIGAGASTLFGTHDSGTGITERDVRDGERGEFVLDLDVGIGEVRVRTDNTGEARP